MAQGNFKAKTPKVNEKQKHKKGSTTKKGGLHKAPVKKAAVHDATRNSKVACKASDRIEGIVVDKAASTGKLNLFKNQSGRSKQSDKNDKEDQ